MSIIRGKGSASVEAFLLDTIGIAVIGRNEGIRLRTCLRSALSAISNGQIVYVDSASTDASVDIARQLGVTVVELASTSAFTAARARNAGFAALQEHVPTLEFVQFVDGDCELQAGWLSSAVNFLRAHTHVAVVCGHNRERFPHRSIYNWLCEVEWAAASGAIEATGGNALYRVTAFEQVGGFLPNLPGGEETEICFRLRQCGWSIWRLNVEMTLHDAAMERFQQWWLRTARGGYAFAQVSHLHWRSRERLWQREVLRILFWTILLPAGVFVGALLNKVALLGLLLYPAQICRVALRQRGQDKKRWAYAGFMMLAKFSELHGALNYLLDRWRGKLATGLSEPTR